MIRMRLLGNGKELVGKTWKEALVALLNSTDFKQTPEQYMKGTAFRAKVYCGETLRYSDYETFLQELERIHIITIIEEEEE